MCIVLRTVFYSDVDNIDTFDGDGCGYCFIVYTLRIGHSHTCVFNYSCRHCFDYNQGMFWLVWFHISVFCICFKFVLFFDSLSSVFSHIVIRLERLFDVVVYFGTVDSGTDWLVLL